MKKENNSNWPNINIDYLSLYNGKKYSSTDFDKLLKYVKELRMKYKNQQNG